LLIDSGSDQITAECIKNLSQEFHFCRYLYLNTNGLIWNKSYAINVGANNIKGDVIMIVDVDLVFASDFICKVSKLSFEGVFYNYKCHYLPSNYDYNKHNWKDFNSNYLKNSGLAPGLVIVSKNDFFAIRGYDEYFQGWGLEDNDFCSRLKALLLDQVYLNHLEFISLHQWHPESYSNVPTIWYINLLQYMHDNKSFPRNGNGMGLVLESNLRVCLSEEYVKLPRTKLSFNQFLSITAFNDIYTVFFELRSNTAMEIEYIEPSLLDSNSYKYKLKDIILSFVIRDKIINNYRSLLSHNYLTTEKLYEFMVNFLSINRQQCLDYYIKYLPKKSLHIRVVKK
jgi:hypothetical protein